MTDEAYEKLKAHVRDGKTYFDGEKVKGTQDSEKNKRLLIVWHKYIDQYLAENMRRAKSILNKEPEKKGLIWFQGEWHSKAWVAMKEREEIDEARRTKARVAARERAERKRKGIT